ncbi:MAG: DUF5721 family protein [Eubacterium sp.]|nr:DUF5721 family protein [Eubacterium sp.]
MIAIQIEKNGPFMKQLLIGSLFDAFLVSSIEVTTYVSFKIDGALHPDFYPKEDAEAIRKNPDRLARWKQIKSFVTSVVSGERQPLLLKVVLQVPKDQAQEMLSASGISCAPEDLYGLFLNLQFKDGVLTLTTGCSVRLFTAEHEVARMWDSSVKKFLEKYELA